MVKWSWKQAVAEQIIDIINSRLNGRFTLNDLYLRESNFQKRFPRNKHIREKVRQTLQRLRDASFVVFLGGGSYQLNFQFEGLVVETAMRGQNGIRIPETRKVIRMVRLRDTLLACDMKRRYKYHCQVCRETVKLFNCNYAESHHLKPIGSPHFGPDVEANIIVTCPNHHVMLDRGAILINPVSLTVSHVKAAFPSRKLFLMPWHDLDRECMRYYCEQICSSAFKNH